MSLDELRRQTEEFNDAVQIYTPPSSAEVGAFFDRNHDVLQAVHHGNVHYGYWTGPDDTSDFEAATSRMTDVLVDRLGAASGHRVLDLGCGSGRPGLHLVRRTGAELVGVSVSRRDVAAATARAAAEGLADRAAFQHADALSLPFEDASFDAVLVLGAMGFIGDRAGALLEIGRVLRPGGRVVLMEEIRLGTAELSEEDLYIQAAVASAWSAALPTTAAEYPKFCRRAGLEIDELTDITEHTKYTYGHIYVGLREYAAAHEELTPEMAEILEMGEEVDWDEHQSSAQTDGAMIVVAHRSAGLPG